MKNFNIAIIGCGVVGSGTAKILLDLSKKLKENSNADIKLTQIVDLFPKKSASSYNLPINLFSGSGEDLTKDQADEYINQIINNSEIDLVVETIGGTSDYLLDIILKTLKAGKHIVTANKAMLAKHGSIIFKTADENGVKVGYEASVCGAIPVIKAIRECFSADVIESFSGIMNGTSNYILSKMTNDRLDFDSALKKAQEYGYAEADPALDINGHDAGHKLSILLNLAFNAITEYDDIPITGVEEITMEDIDFANEMDCVIKLICFAKKIGNDIFAAVGPMMVKKSNFLSNVNGSTNAVLLNNKYSDSHILIGKGAGSLETASSIVSDIVFIAKYNSNIKNLNKLSNITLTDFNDFSFPYNITFYTEDYPGITGLVTTCIGNQQINIDTVSHNRHNIKDAVFSIATMPCTLAQINKAVKEIKQKNKKLLKHDPKILPILY